MADQGVVVDDLLIELGCEELPPKALVTLASEFAKGVVAGLDKAGFGHGEATVYASPRRLAMVIPSVPQAQQAQESERRGPAVLAAFDADGNPTKAAQGFAASCGIEVSQLGRLTTDKGEWLVHREVQQGATLNDTLSGIADAALAGLPIPKRMRWGAGTAEFVRPVHWLVMLHGDAVVPGQVLGLSSGNRTRGHRFMSSGELTIPRPGDYPTLLRDRGSVLVSIDERRQAIKSGVAAVAAEIGGRAVINDDLLDEVTSLVEWPVPLVGGFDSRFLDVPAEALVSSMQGHQKCFPVVDGAGALMPYFVAVANIASRDPKMVRAGNERVIRPRLADAEFFWNQDKKKGLDTLRGGLTNMTFQVKLGSLADKSERVGRLAATIAEAIGGTVAHALRAAHLAKADLLSAMVFEFPELQGVMGRYYAEAESEAVEVSSAIEEQYLPRFAGDMLPAGKTGFALALADRLDTLVGIFSIGQKPTGNKDPYGLRRASLGVLRMLIESRHDLDLRDLIHKAESGLADKLDGKTVTDEVFDYVMDRLKVYYSDKGIDLDVIDAVMGVRATKPLDFDNRVRAVQAFRGTVAGQTLAAANKRIGNILKKSDIDAAQLRVDVALLSDPAELALWKAVEAVRADVTLDFDRGDYEAGLARLTPLKEPVDAFFDSVMVMAEDEALKLNRLGILRDLSNLFSGAAEFSRLQG